MLAIIIGIISLIVSGVIILVLYNVLEGMKIEIEKLSDQLDLNKARNILTLNRVRELEEEVVYLRALITGLKANKQGLK